MMAIEMMYQQYPTQEEQNSNILGTRDEIEANEDSDDTNDINY